VVLVATRTGKTSTERKKEGEKRDKKARKELRYMSSHPLLEDCGGMGAAKTRGT